MSTTNRTSLKATLIKQLEMLDPKPIIPFGLEADKDDPTSCTMTMDVFESEIRKELAKKGDNWVLVQVPHDVMRIVIGGHVFAVRWDPSFTEADKAGNLIKSRKVSLHTKNLDPREPYRVIGIDYNANCEDSPSLVKDEQLTFTLSGQRVFNESTKLADALSDRYDTGDDYVDKRTISLRAANSDMFRSTVTLIDVDARMRAISAVVADDGRMEDFKAKVREIFPESTLSEVIDKITTCDMNDAALIDACYTTMRTIEDQQSNDDESHNIDKELMKRIDQAIGYINDVAFATNRNSGSATAALRYARSELDHARSSLYSISSDDRTIDQEAWISRITWCIGVCEDIAYTANRNTERVIGSLRNLHDGLNTIKTEIDSHHKLPLIDEGFEPGYDASKTFPMKMAELLASADSSIDQFVYSESRSSNSMTLNLRNAKSSCVSVKGQLSEVMKNQPDPETENEYQRAIDSVSRAIRMIDGIAYTENRDDPSCIHKAGAAHSAICAAAQLLDSIDVIETKSPDWYTRNLNKVMNLASSARIAIEYFIGLKDKTTSTADIHLNTAHVTVDGALKIIERRLNVSTETDTNPGLASLKDALSVAKANVDELYRYTTLQRVTVAAKACADSALIKLKEALDVIAAIDVTTA